MSDFRFGHVAFFGRSIQEYVAMFNLDLLCLHGTTMLDCPAGPSAFARQAADLGLSVIACDPMFELGDVQELRHIVDRDAEAVTKKQAANRETFHKQLVPTAERRRAMEVFLNDYADQGAKRYVAGKLPVLPFEDHSFDTILSGNFLFLYGDPESGGMMDNSPFDYEFHQKALAELMRVCRKDIRIYPLQGPNVTEHSYLRSLMEGCEKVGFSAELQPVKQRDIIGAETMLLISRTPDNSIA